MPSSPIDIRNQIINILGTSNVSNGYTNNQRLAISIKIYQI